MEVDQQPDLQTEDTQMRECLGFVHRVQLFLGFAFHDNLSFDQQICSEATLASLSGSRISILRSSASLRFYYSFLGTYSMSNVKFSSTVSCEPTPFLPSSLVTIFNWLCTWVGPCESLRGRR